MQLSTVDKMGRKVASWVVIDKTTGDAVLETFSIDTANAINTKKYDVLPIYDYLIALNKRIKRADNRFTPR